MITKTDTLLNMYINDEKPKMTIQNNIYSNNIFLYILTIILIIGIGFFMYIILTSDLKENTVAMYILGTSNAILMGILSFFYGSSKGSKTKDSILNDILNKRTRYAD